VHVDCAASGGQRRGALAQERLHAPGMIDVVVGESHSPETALGIDHLEQALEMFGKLRSRVDDVGGMIAYDPGVGARKREWSRVPSAQAHDVVTGEPLSVVVGVAVGGPLEIFTRAAVRARWKQRGHPGKF
jgi:hypothetical protein